MPATPRRSSFRARKARRLRHGLPRPAGPPLATAIFAHCFTCSKDTLAASRIARELAAHGFAVLRFDFTGLGASEGDFGNPISPPICGICWPPPIICAARECRRPADRHSLGGAGLAAAADIPEVKAVATIGAPADAAHVVQHFAAHLDTIRDTGEAEVTLYPGGDSASRGNCSTI